MVSPLEADVGRWLFGFVRPDVPRGSEAWRNAQDFFAALGDPQDRVRAVHVVGTAGKGTVARLIARELRRAGITTGLHLSPHVYDIRERFTVAEELPPWELVAAAVDEIQAVVDDGHRPTFFAVTTAMALVLARQVETDMLVIEAGIGGRLDATNTFHRADVVTVLTAIGLDHQDLLGPTIDRIASEKSAVLQGRDWAVLGPQSSLLAHRSIRSAGRRYGTRFLDVAPTGDWRNDAAATAHAVLGRFLSDAAMPLPLDQPGRFEVEVVDQRRWIFDGAHNPMKLAALVGSLTGEPGPLTGVVAIGAGKDLAGCAAVLASALETAIVVEFAPSAGQYGPVSHPSDQVVQALRAAGVADVVAARDARSAVATAVERHTSTVVVTGSFLHLGSIRNAVRAQSLPVGEIADPADGSHRS